MRWRRRAAAPGRPAGRRRARAGLAVGAVVVAALAGRLGFRTWLAAAPAADAPRVGLAVGDDLLNAVGVHQAAYQAALVGAGAAVVEVSPERTADPDAVLDGVDALVLTGGGDVGPGAYGGAAEAQLVDPERDDFEVALVRGALARDMPVLAVCRGHQLLVVALGGSLRDVRDDPALARTHGITARSLTAHEVRLAPGSRLYALSGGSALEVNSFHGQVVDRVPPGLRVVARAPDGVIEAVEVPGARYALGVQWHPELLAVTEPGARALFEALVAEARRYRAERAAQG